MREILFRGKRIDNGAWVEGFLVMKADPLLGIIASFILTQEFDTSGILRSHMDWYKVDPETVGQYTGLTDKNGTKIFEGDIVHYQYFPGKGYWNSDQYSIIEWNSTGFDMRGIMGTNKYACCSGWLVSIPHGDGHYFEVIGNVHDNPELLGEG